MSPVMTLPRLARRAPGSGFSLQGAGKLAARALFCGALAGLTGCATSAELESLRAEVARANANAARAAVEVASAQRELAELKAAVKPPETFSKAGTRPVTPLAKPAGYKWGKAPQ